MYNYTKDDIVKLNKCLLDPKYFIQKYCITQNGASLNFNSNSNHLQWMEEIRQKQIISLGEERQTGKTQFIVAYSLHYALFNPGQSIMILSPSLQWTVEIRTRMEYMFMMLPEMLKMNMIINNSQMIEFVNGSRIIFKVADSCATRGCSLNLLCVDGWDLIKPFCERDALLASCVPTLNPGGKVIIAGEATWQQ